MIRTILNDEQWKQIAPELPGKVGDPGATARNNRLFVEAHEVLISRDRDRYVLNHLKRSGHKPS